jgi:hypothetical protein
MTKNALFRLILTSISTAIFTLSGNADETGTTECSPCYQFPLGHKLSVGPEIYHLQRIREGGTKQDGWLYGVRASYDRIKRYKFYWGVEGHWAQGTLHGHNGAGDKLKSTFTDEQIEGRLGYTFQAKCLYQPAITPFAGYGYFRDTNKFKNPSPLTVKFVTTYRYAVYGFLSSIAPADSWNVGLNFKGWSMIHARAKVQDDPDEDDVTMLIGEKKLNYRIEVPVLYRYCCCNEHLEVGVVPFYEFRHYGRRENYPFDFADTKFKLWGVTFELTYRL